MIMTAVYRRRVALFRKDTPQLMHPYWHPRGLDDAIRTGYEQRWGEAVVDCVRERVSVRTSHNDRDRIYMRVSNAKKRGNTTYA